MIVTFTANPSIDRTVLLPGALARGQVQRVASVSQQAAGKGVNVATVLLNAGLPARAVTSFADPAYIALAERQQPPITIEAVSVDGPYTARLNTTITEPDGTTTKINELGPTLSPKQVFAAADKLVSIAAQARWVVLSGSLPPGAPDDWYARIVRRLDETCRIAIDTSGPALDSVLTSELTLDLIKPNSDELAQLTGGSAAQFEADAAAGRFAAIVEAARSLGVANVLVTLGGAGAILVNEQGAWQADAPTIDVRSTVGAGDSSLAGFIAAHERSDDPDSWLVSAVSYGSAAASLPGTQLPTPDDLPEGVSARRL